MDVGLKALCNKNTFSEITCSDVPKIIISTWAFQWWKMTSSGEIHKYKAQFVVCGDLQIGTNISAQALVKKFSSNKVPLIHVYNFVADSCSHSTSMTASLSAPTTTWMQCLMRNLRMLSDLDVEDDYTGYLGVDIIIQPDGTILMLQTGLIEQILTDCGLSNCSISLKVTPASDVLPLPHKDSAPFDHSFNYRSVLGKILCSLICSVQLHYHYQTINVQDSLLTPGFLMGLLSSASVAFSWALAIRGGWYPWLLCRCRLCRFVFFFWPERSQMCQISFWIGHHARRYSRLLGQQVTNQNCPFHFGGQVHFTLSQTLFVLLPLLFVLDEVTTSFLH